MPFVLGLLSVIAVLSSVLLMFVVLLQEPKGGGIAAALGGSGMEAIGPAVGGVNRFTTWVAGIWMVVCFLHSIWMKPGVALEPVAKDKTADTQQPGQPDPGQQNAPGQPGTQPKGR